MQIVAVERGNLLQKIGFSIPLDVPCVLMFHFCLLVDSWLARGIVKGEGLVNFQKKNPTTAAPGEGRGPFLRIIHLPASGSRLSTGWGQE